MLSCLATFALEHLLVFVIACAVTLQKVCRVLCSYLAAPPPRTSPIVTSSDMIRQLPTTMIHAPRSSPWRCPGVTASPRDEKGVIFESCQSVRGAKASSGGRGINVVALKATGSATQRTLRPSSTSPRMPQTARGRLDERMLLRAFSNKAIDTYICAVVQ